MAQSTRVELQGVLTGAPSSPSFYSGTLQELLPVSFCDVYTAIKNGVITVNSTDGVPFILPFENILKGRIFALRLLAGLTCKVILTSGLGDAAFNVSDQFLLRVRNPGDEFTAIKIVTAAQQVDLAYLLAGDVA